VKVRALRTAGSLRALLSLMKLERAGGAYLAARERRHRLELMGFAGAGLVASVAAGVAVNPLVGLVAGLAAGSMAGPALGRLRDVRAGRLGEASVTELLSGLSDDYFLVNDVILPYECGNVDHVLIGPFGIMALETKRWGGSIRVRNNRWLVNGIPRGDVARQVTEGAIAVKEFLSRAHPELGRSLLRWVEGVVVLAHPLCRVKVARSWAPVVRFSELLSLIAATPVRPRYTPELGQMLADVLSRGARDSVLTA
jgi:hypothetical protein